MKKVIFVLMLSIVAFTYYSCDTSSFDSAQRAAERPVNEVVTIYFIGSTGTGDMWMPEESNFGRSETVATLHHFQKDKSDPGFSNHHKIVINGIGKVIVPLLDDWNTKWQEANDALLPILDECEGECITLNLVGFSRGGVSAMHFATDITKDDNFKGRIEKFNILAFDPVPGGITYSHYFNLPANTEYLGFYAVDERSLGFAPVFPYRGHPRNLLINFFTVPGSHETMVGSIKTNGHDHNFSDDNEDKNLTYLSRTLKIVATEMLGSSDWGHVRFRQPNMDGSVEEEYFTELELDWYKSDTNLSLLKNRFSGEMKDIYKYDGYGDMHKDSFIEEIEVMDPITGVVVVVKDAREAWAGTACWAVPFASRDNPRCVYYQTGEWTTDYLGLANTSLDDENLNLFLSPLNKKEQKHDNFIFTEEYKIWNLIRNRGSLDVDADMIDYSDDNCPEVYNPYQRNTDGDDLGDACDPDDDNDGVLDESDICPYTPKDGIVHPDNGCTLDQFAPCAGPRGTDDAWSNHGEYVSARTKFANDFVKMGLLTHKENADIVSEAAKSDCGRTLW